MVVLWFGQHERAKAFEEGDEGSKEMVQREKGGKGGFRVKGSRPLLLLLDVVKTFQTSDYFKGGKEPKGIRTRRA